MKKKAIGCVIKENENHVFDFLFTGDYVISIGFAEVIKEIGALASIMVDFSEDFFEALTKYQKDYALLCASISTQAVESVYENVGKKHPEIADLFEKVFLYFSKDYFFNELYDYYIDALEDLDWKRTCLKKIKREFEV